MRKILLLSTLIVLVSSCTVKKKPVFTTVENIAIINSSAKAITFKVNAVFTNPNDIGGTLNCENITILINDVEFGNITSEDFKVPAHQEFRVPLEVVLNTEDLLKRSSKNSIGSVLNSIIKKSIKVQYRGDIIYKTLGFSYKYPIDITENIKL